ncbi:hypothetical protein ABTE64_18060, partial [Acinetobacter baumannii]
APTACWRCTTTSCSKATRARSEDPDVPVYLRRRTEAFLIHQYMLVEGIDDPAGTMLALYSSFPTERQLVQQVGRITRHGGRIGAPVS